MSVTKTDSTVIYEKREKVQPGSAIMGAVCVFGGWAALAKAFGGANLGAENLGIAWWGLGFFGGLLLLGGILLILLPFVEIIRWKRNETSPLIAFSRKGFIISSTGEQHAWDEHWEDVVVEILDWQLHLQFLEKGKVAKTIVIEGEPNVPTNAIEEQIRRFLV